MTAPARYVDALRELSVLDAASYLGLELVEHRATTSPASFSCPLCGAETRHDERRRGACGVRPDGKGWRCFECAEGGDAITLVCAVMFGKTRLRDLSPEQRLELRDWTADRRAVAPIGPRLVPKPPEYPPFERVASQWRSCGPVTRDRDVRSWLEDHRIDPEMVCRRDLARALPVGYGSEWSDAGNRLVLPLRDHTGYPRSIKARFIGFGTGDLPKSVSPGGFSAKGLSFFDHRQGQARSVWFVEGEKKYLQLVSLLPADAMVVGIGSGMYSAELVARFSGVGHVRLATDPDVKHKAGARYATEIARLLTPEQWARCWHYDQLRVADEEQRVFTTASANDAPQIDDLIERGDITRASDLLKCMVKR